MKYLFVTLMLVLGIIDDKGYTAELRYDEMKETYVKYIVDITKQDSEYYKMFNENIFLGQIEGIEGKAAKNFDYLVRIDPENLMQSLRILKSFSKFEYSYVCQFPVEKFYEKLDFSISDCEEARLSIHLGNYQGLPFDILAPVDRSFRTFGMQFSLAYCEFIKSNLAIAVKVKMDEEYFENFILPDQAYRGLLILNDI